MADQFDEFLQEVQQDIQQEKYLRLWQRYGKHVTTAAIVLLAGASSYVLWNNYQGKRQENLSNAIFTAQNYAVQQKSHEALAILDSLSVSGNDTYGYMRQLQKAALLLTSAETEKEPEKVTKDREEALALYRSMGQNKGLPMHVREYGSFLYVRTLWDLKKGTAKEALDLLVPLMEDKKPWKIFAKELAALIHYQEHAFKEALELFVSIVKDEGTPEGLRMRARMMSQLAQQKVSFKTPSSEPK